MSAKRGDSDRDAINLRSLRRNDSHITNILYTSSAVGVYQYCCDTKKWIKLEIEGPLHIVRRSINPTTMMVVINRLNTNNLVEAVTEHTDVFTQLPYLMFRNKDKYIYCVWFYSEDECQETAKLLQSELVKFSKNMSSSHDQTCLTPSSPATASLVDTLAQIGIKKITVAKSTANRTPGPGHSIETTPAPSSSLPENGRKSVDLHDLFAQATLAKMNPNNIYLPRSAPRAILRNNNFVSVNLLHDLEKASSNEESKENDDEMLTPAMIKEKTKKEVKDEDLFSLNDLVTSKETNQSPYVNPKNSSELSLHNPNRSIGVENHDDPLPIDQLKKTLIHLVQNDVEFVAKIRAALLSRSAPR